MWRVWNRTCSFASYSVYSYNVQLISYLGTTAALWRTLFGLAKTRGHFLKNSNWITQDLVSSYFGNTQQSTHSWKQCIVHNVWRKTFLPAIVHERQQTSNNVMSSQSQRHRYENIRAVPEQGQRSKSAPLWGGSGECWRERLRRTLSRRSGCSVGPTERRRRMWSRTPGNTRPALSHCASLNKQINTLHASNATVGNLFRTADRFQPGISLRTGPQLNSWCLAHVNLLQLVNHHGTDSLRDLGLLYSNKKLWSVGIMVVNGTRSVFLMSVVPVTLRPI